MKIEVSRISLEGLTLEDTLDPKQLDLDTDQIKFSEPIYVKLEAVKITNAVTVALELCGNFQTICSRCLKETEIEVKRKLKFNYPVKGKQEVINLDDDIRQELILDYPLRFLCKPDCRGFCPYCGKNLNEGSCNCSSKSISPGL